MPNKELVRLHFGKHDTNNTGRLSTDELLSLLKDLQVLGMEAMLILKSHGYRNVKSLNGGLDGWIREGLPTRRSSE